MYGFTRSPSIENAFYHSNFVKGERMLSLQISRRKDRNVGGGGGGSSGGMGRGFKAALPVKRHPGKNDTTIQRTSASLLSPSSDTVIREIPTSSTAFANATSIPRQSQSTQLTIQSSISMEPRHEEELGYTNLARRNVPLFSSPYASTHPFQSQHTQQPTMYPTNVSNIGLQFLPSWLREDDNDGPNNVANEGESSSLLRNLLEPRTIEEMSKDYANKNEGKSDDNDPSTPPSFQNFSRFL